MSLLVMDGFDLTDMALRYVNAPSNSGTTRFGTGASLRVVNTTIPINFTASSEIYAGLALIKGSATFPFFFQFASDSGATTHLSVEITVNGGINIRLGGTAGTVLASVADGTIVTTNWNYIEVRALVNDSTGVCEVRLNGATSATVSFGPGDTRNLGTSANIDRLTLNCTGGSSAWSVDDLYILNTSGSANNTWLGDVRVVTIRPDANGTSSQLTGSDGNSTDNYLLVDEVAYSTADYTGSSTSGHTDLYGMSNLPAGTISVFGVQEVLIAFKSDAGSGGIKPKLRTNSTNYTGSTAYVSTNATPVAGSIRETNPNTGVAWTPAEIDAMEAGAEVA